MFDAAHGVRHDGSSQGGFLCLLTHKQAFEGVETPDQVLEWKSFKLPRVARSSLAAEAQAAGAAADSVEFIVRFSNELMNRGLDLKANLAMDISSLQPVLITDAKALYDMAAAEDGGPFAGRFRAWRLVCMPEGPKPRAICR